MNKIIVLIAILVVTTIKAKSQSVDSAVTRNFANKLKDSLSLTQGQANAVYQISKAARIQKKQVWSQYRGTKDFQKRMIQEDSRRDSLIRNIIGEEKYNLYFQRRWMFLLTN